MAAKLKEPIAIQDAMNNLEAINQIDLNAPGPIGILKKTRIITNEEEFPKGHVEWLGAEGSEVLLDVLDATYKAVHDYLIYLSQSPDVDWKSERGITLIKQTVSIAASAAHKMEKYLELRLGRPNAKINEREEFQEMNNYYELYFSKKAKKTQDLNDLAEKGWDKENDLFNIRINAEKPPKNSRNVTERPEYKAMHDFYVKQFAEEIALSEPHNPAEKAFQDLNELRLDKEYELFYIRHEDGMPFYDVEILRNMRLICDFESNEGGFEEDPLLQIRSILDRDAAAAAGQILGECDHQIADFYKVFKKLINNDFAVALNKVCIGLLLTKNPRNLLQNSTGKTSLQYFEDFHIFLRNAFKTAEYQKLIAYPPDKSDKMAVILLTLAHTLARAFFQRATGVKNESIGLIHRTARKGGSSKKIKAHSLWSELLLEDEAYRTLLSKFPSGPLLKTLDLIRDTEDESPPFDPIAQGNFPIRLFEMGAGNGRIDFLHLPSPVRQYVISKVELLDEFRGMLRSYIAANLEEKHLLINLQDNTSWKEIARCNALDGMQKNAEFSKALYVATLSQNSPFYFQTGRYEGVSASESFMRSLTHQSLEENGISFPTGYKSTDFGKFSEAITPFIHKHFFEKKKSLTRQEREEFIDLFDLFFSLKLIEHYKPTTVSFTSKDSVDTGAVQSASFFAFLKMLTDDFSKKESQDTFRWLLYNQALFVRERAVEQARLCRALSALQCFETGWLENSKGILKDMGTIFKPQFLKNLAVKG